MNKAKKGKRLSLDEAAERMAAIVEEHFAKLTPAEREKRWNAFTRVVGRIREKHAKPEAPPRTRVTRLPSRARG